MKLDVKKEYNQDKIYTFNIDGHIFIDKFQNICKFIYIAGIKTNYMVDKMGNVYNSKSGRVKKPVLSSGGYYRVQLSIKGKKPKSFSIHRLVAVNFISNIDNKPEVNHKDGKKYNNTIFNLEWVTHSENTLHAFENGLNSNIGSLNPNAKLTEEDVRAIWELLLLDDSLTMLKIGEMFGVSKPTISHIFHGDTWKKFYDEFHDLIDNQHVTKKYSDDLIRYARYLIHNSKYTMKEISKLTKINLNYLYTIKLNYYRKDIL